MTYYVLARQVLGKDIYAALFLAVTAGITSLCVISVATDLYLRGVLTPVEIIFYFHQVDAWMYWFWTVLYYITAFTKRW